MALLDALPNRLNRSLLRLRLRLQCFWLLIRSPSKVLPALHQHMLTLLENGPIKPEQDKVEDELDWDTFIQLYPDAIMTEEEIEAEIAYYEQKFGLTSQEFLQRVRKGTAPVLS